MLYSYKYTNHENTSLFVWIEPLCFSEELSLNDSIEILVESNFSVDYKLIEAEVNQKQLNIFINNKFGVTDSFNIKIIKNYNQLFEITI